MRTAIASRISRGAGGAPRSTRPAAPAADRRTGRHDDGSGPFLVVLVPRLSIASVRRNGHRGKWRAPGGPTVPARCCCCCGAVGRPRPAGARQGRGRRQRPSLSAPTASDARLDRSYTNSSESRASSSDDPFFFPLRSQSETQRQQRKRLRTHGMSLIDRGRRIYSPARRRLHAIHANKYYHS